MLCILYTILYMVYINTNHNCTIYTIYSLQAASRVWSSVWSGTGGQCDRGGVGHAEECTGATIPGGAAAPFVV